MWCRLCRLCAHVAHGHTARFRKADLPSLQTCSPLRLLAAAEHAITFELVYCGIKSRCTCPGSNLLIAINEVIEAATGHRGDKAAVAAAIHHSIELALIALAGAGRGSIASRSDDGACEEERVSVAGSLRCRVDGLAGRESRRTERRRLRRCAPERPWTLVDAPWKAHAIAGSAPAGFRHVRLGRPSVRTGHAQV